MATLIAVCPDIGWGSRKGLLAKCVFHSFVYNTCFILQTGKSESSLATGDFPIMLCKNGLWKQWCFARKKGTFIMIFNLKHFMAVTFVKNLFQYD